MTNTVANVTASGADRAIKCPASLAYPQARTITDASEKGNDGHEFLRRVAKDANDQDNALAALPLELRARYENFSREKALGDLEIIGCEMAYVLELRPNFNTYHFVGENVNRNYGAIGKYDVGVTLDVEAKKTDGTIVAIDWKTGRYHLGEPENSWQMRLQAYALMMKYDINKVEVRIGYVDENADVYYDTHTFHFFSVQTEVDAIPAAIDKADVAANKLSNDEIPTVTLGDHCTFCPALPYCHGHTAMVRKLLPELDGLDVKLLSTVQKGQAWLRAKQMEKLGKEIVELLKMDNKDEPFPVDEGYEIRPIEKTKEYFDSGLAKGLLIRLGATEADLTKLVKTSTYQEHRRLKIVK
jgi:hypothetical protein